MGPTHRCPRAARASVTPRRLAGLAALCACVVTTAPAAADDLQFWPTFTVYSPTVDGWRGSAELHARWTDDLGTYNRIVLRVNGGRLVTPRLELFAGYENTRPGTPGVRHEQRVWEQVEYTHRPGRWSFAGRARLEERFIERADAVAVRLRCRFRAQHPLARTRWTLAATEELWIHLNSVEGTTLEGVDQNRVALTALRFLNPHLSIEPGYMHVYSNAPSPRPNAVAHVMTLQVTARF
jgi:hypothetical protein